MKISMFRMQVIIFSLVFLTSLTILEMIPANTLAEGVKIGVIDIGKVFEKYEKRKDKDQELKDLEKEFQNEINKRRKEIIDLDEETQLLDLGSESRRKNEELLERKKVEIEGYAKFAEGRLLRRSKELLEMIYDEIVKEVEIIGEKENFDLIIKKEDPELRGRQITDLQLEIVTKTVLYHSKAVNITSMVVESLNARYLKEKEKEQS